MTILYLDECGEEGFSDTSSEWFILGGAVHRDGYASAIIPHYEAFCAKPNKDLIGLQVADCFASALGQALEKNDYGMTECCYVRQLSPRIMNLNGSSKGTGIKLWPHPQPSFLDHARFNWWNEMD